TAWWRRGPGRRGKTPWWTEARAPGTTSRGAHRIRTSARPCGGKGCGRETRRPRPADQPSRKTATLASGCSAWPDERRFRPESATSERQYRQLHERNALELSNVAPESASMGGL